MRVWPLGGASAAAHMVQIRSHDSEASLHCGHMTSDTGFEKPNI